MFDMRRREFITQLKLLTGSKFAGRFKKAGRPTCRRRDRYRKQISVGYGGREEIADAVRKLRQNASAARRVAVRPARHPRLSSAQPGSDDDPRQRRRSVTPSFAHSQAKS